MTVAQNAFATEAAEASEQGNRARWHLARKNNCQDQEAERQQGKAGHVTDVSKPHAAALAVPKEETAARAISCDLRDVIVTSGWKRDSC